MRKTRELETPGDRADRRDREARARNQRARADDIAIDAAIRRSIEQYGA